jgi:hypothetical protein
VVQGGVVFEGVEAPADHVVDVVVVAVDRALTVAADTCRRPRATVAQAISLRGIGSAALDQRPAGPAGAGLSKTRCASCSRVRW